MMESRHEDNSYLITMNIASINETTKELFESEWKSRKICSEHLQIHIIKPFIDPFGVM